MQEQRRDFLKKSLKIGTVATASIAATSLMANAQSSGSSGVVRGKAKKKEVLYSKSEAWEKYYKVAY